MNIRIHSHAKERMIERGATLDEVISTVKYGERFPAKYGRIGFRRNFTFGGIWNGKYYSMKQVEIYAVEEEDLLVLTLIVKYY